MEKIESFGVGEENDNKKEIDEENKDLIDRYRLDNSNNLNIPLIYRNRKKEKFPAIFYVLIFALLLLLSLVIFLIVEHFKKKINYSIEEELFLKPNISHHNYTKISFKNGLELLLIQVDENDIAGGSIVFDTGFLDTNYSSGFVKLALIGLKTKIENSETLNDYLGVLDYNIGEHYSSFNFKILNAGFFSYLQIFAKLTTLNENINCSAINKNLKSKSNKEKNNLIKREEHLLQYLIYGYNDNEKDIFPEGNNITDDFCDTKIEIIKNITASLLNPSKMKIVLNSHFKMSLMKHKFLKYFHNIANIDFKKTEQNYSYNINEFKAKKMIFMKLKNYQTNYIKINYYITPEDKNLNNLTINSGYFHYIKYILDETNPESLYYNLTHSQEYNIKSLSCNFDVILKSKIKFSINIYLNYYSYKNIDAIILKVYQYMDNLKEYVNKLIKEDNRIDELYDIMAKNFSFSEDLHDITPNNEAKGINLFLKKDKVYFLRDAWFPGKFNISKFKEYISQITFDNSVLIIAINNDTLQRHKNDLEKSKISYIFTKKNEYIEHYNIQYNIYDLDGFFKNNLNNEKHISLINYSNEYISKYNGSSELEFYESDRDNYLNLKDSEILNDTNLTIFYYKRDTSFHIPKVFISLNFFHPFMRPNEKGYKDQRYFEVMLYISYIKREINLQLADAIRAGNIIYITYNTNLIYINIFVYSDLAIKILEIIKGIVKNISKYNEIFTPEKFEIYRDAALEDYLNFRGDGDNRRMMMAFYEHLYDENKNEVGFYNYYNFNRTKYKDITIEEMESSLKLDTAKNYINSYILNGHVYGYLTYNETMKIYNLFNENNNNFEATLDFLNITKLNVNKDNFTDWLTKKNNLESNKTVYFPNCKKNISFYRYLHWSKYDSENKVITNVFNKLLGKAITNNNTILSDSYVFSQSEIYFQFKIKEDVYDFKNHVEAILNDTQESFKENIDSVGSRLYYIIRNFVDNLNSHREDMKSSALTRIYSNTFNNDDFRDLLNIKNWEYEDFINRFKEIYQKEFHIDFICNNPK